MNEFHTNNVSMDSPKETDVGTDIFKLSEDPDYEGWDTDYEYGACEEETEDSFEEEEYDEDEEKRKESDEADIFPDFVKQFEDKRAREVATRAEEKKQQLRLLIGLEKKREVSEETLLTPDEEIPLPVASSSESSIHPCFQDVEISDSQLKLSNLYTMYPVPDDPGLVPAFWTIFERPPNYNEDGVEKLIDLTKKSGLRPIQSLKDMLLTDNVNLQYYGFDPRIVRVICEALMENPLVQRINLQDNWLSLDACYHLNDLLLRNNVVDTLLLARCHIGAKGVAKLRDGIAKNCTLKTLDLSDCNIREEGLNDVAIAVCKSQSLESLALNNNNLNESCAEALQYLLSYSESLKQLKLSWNALYTSETWKKLIKGFDLNKALADLDLSWNALGKECVPHLQKLLSRSAVLKKLNISGNRFYDADISPVAKALSKNKTLQELHMGNNPLKADGALNLVRAIAPSKSPESQMRVLELTNIWAKKDILPELKAIETSKPWVQVKLGGILSNYEIVGPDPKKIFLKRANYEALKPKKKKQRKNFGHFVLSLMDNPVSRTNFKGLVKAYRLKLSDSLVEEIMNTFAGPKNTVDLAFLKSFYMKQYPDTQLPPKKPAKKKKAKGEKSKKSGKKLKVK